jgi:hypothetical protein
MGGDLICGSRTSEINLTPEICLAPLAPVKIIVNPPAWGISLQHDAVMISGNSNGLADCMSQGFSGTAEQQPIGDRICFSAGGCRWVGPAWQQHFIPQPSDPIAPVANRLPPRIRTMAVHTAFSMVDLFPAAVFFIVKYYTKYHIVLSIKMIKDFLNFRKRRKLI